MSDAEYQRWESIVERETLGERIDVDDLAFRSEYESTHPQCARESEAWSRMLGALSEEAEGMEQADALAARVLVQRDVERDVVRPLRPTAGRGNSLRTALLATAAAAAVAAVVSSRLTDEPAPAPAARNEFAPPNPAELEPEPTDRTSLPATRGRTSVSAPDLGRLALAGDGVRIDGGAAMAGSIVRPDQRIDFEPSIDAEGAGACVVQQSPWIATCFSRGSELMFTESESGSAVELRRGRVLVRLDELPTGRSFSVFTSKGSVAAIGTAFEVWIDEQGTVHASVLDGKVDVRDTLGLRPLAAGETTRMGSPDVSRFDADAVAWSRAHVDATQLWRHSGPGLLVVVSAEDNTSTGSVSLDALPVGRAPLSMLVPPGEHLVGQAGRSRGVSIDIQEGATRELALESDEASVRPTGARARPTVAELLRKASEARTAHRYLDAVTHLDRLVREYPDSPDAQNARVELADLMLDKLGKPARALRLYDTYLSRGGPLMPEARHGRVQALERLGRSRDERVAIEQFLAKHPDDWRAKPLRVRLERL